MVRRVGEQPVKQRENMYGGSGIADLRSLLLGEEEMNGKGRLFNRITLPAGASIGYHVHEGEAETFYILEGRGLFNDNGSEVAFSAGDVLHTAAGRGHGLQNTGDGPLSLIALILFE